MTKIEIEKLTFFPLSGFIIYTTANIYILVVHFRFPISPQASLFNLSLGLHLITVEAEGLMKIGY